jgi:hypothetical protein
MMRTLRNVALAAISFVALVGVLHMPALRPLLLSLAGCPFPTSGRTLSPEEAEGLRVTTFAPKGVQERALAMPALGFALGKDDRRTVAAWARERAVSCMPDKHEAGLRCFDVKASALGAESDERGVLGLGFDAQGVLVSVQYALDESDRARALSFAQRAESELEKAGAATTVRDSDLAGSLSQRQTLVAVRDFRGEVTTTHLGSRYVVAQSYQTFTR